MSRMSDASQATFMEDIPDDIKNGMNPDRYQTVWQKLKNWFGSICSTIGGFFSKLFTETIPNKLDDLKRKLSTFFKQTLPNYAISGIETMCNRIISGFEGLINKPIRGINNFIKTANQIPGVDIGSLSTVKLDRTSLPRLASGTVIPPRHEFAAILGDQRHGTNIEAPLETIKQANREVFKEFFDMFNNLANNVKEVVLRNLTFVIQMGATDLKKIVIDAIRLTEKEIGRPLLLN